MKTKPYHKLIMAARPNAKRLAQFFSHVTKSPNGCWQFSVTSPGGYGVFRSTSAHRFAYAWFAGSIPIGFQIDHLCRNRACVNPAHLEPVTHAENRRRGRFSETTGQCHRGHAMTSANTYVSSRRNGLDRRTCRACERMTRQQRKQQEVSA